MTEQEQIEIGRQAEEFLRYTEEHPYFYNLIERVKLSLAQWILSLPPDQKDQFFVLKTRMDAVGDIMNAVKGDIYIASAALDDRPEKGIL